MATTTGDPGLSVERLQGSPRRRRKEATIKVALAVSAGISLVVSLAIVVALVGQAVNFLSQIELGQLWTSGWFPRDGEFDVLTIFIGTVEVSVIAMLIATPLGLGAAMYLSDAASSPSSRPWRASRAWCSATSRSR
jgi:phosphate transport system permease protein